jgi:hypothetical protein
MDTLIRPAYYGGTCEVYGNPEEGDFIVHYDFTGMYGQCMLEKFPYGKHTIKEANFNIDEPGFYCIDFYSDKNTNIPILPHHRIKNNKLMFTNGLMTGTH